MYGSDAVGGVINIITAPPEGTEFRLRTAVGNFGINQQRVPRRRRSGQLSEQLTFSRDFSSGFAPDRDYRNLRVLVRPRTSAPPGAPSSLTLAYMDHPVRRRPVLRQLQLLGEHENLVRRRAAGFRRAHHRELRLPPPQRSVRALSRPAGGLHQSSLGRKLAGGRAAQRDAVAVDARCFTVSRRCTNRSSATIWATTRAAARAAYAAVDFRALKRFSLSLSAREEALSQLSPAHSARRSRAACGSRQR